MTETVTDNDIAVSLEAVSFSRKGADGAASELLDAVSCTARRSQITAIIGPSGGGKSTLIRLINRLADPTSGAITVNGRGLTSYDPLELRRLVALVPQKAFMFDGTVLDNLQRPFLYRNEAPPGAGSEEVRQALSLARLDPAMSSRDARSLSGGEQQRVALARALVAGPKVLLLDEPTSALDRRTADGIAATLQDICHTKNLALIMVTHDLRLTERIADYCYYLEAGRILEQGRGSEMLAHPKSPQLQRFLAEPTDQEP